MGLAESLPERYIRAEIRRKGNESDMLSADAARVLAICVLVAAAAAPAVWVVIQFRRTPYTRMQTVLYAVNYLMVRVLWRAKINGRWPLPPGQGAVIICNHRGPMDPSLSVIVADRLVHWMVAREYVENLAFGWFLKACNVIPVNRRGTDTAATKLAIRCAQQGGLVALFPEGRINTTEKLLLPFRGGVTMIALKARVPVVPLYIEGSPYDGTPWGCLFMPSNVRLEVGQPIDLSPYYGCEGDRQVRKRLTERFMSAIAELAEPEPDPKPQ